MVAQEERGTPTRGWRVRLELGAPVWAYGWGVAVAEEGFTVAEEVVAVTSVAYLRPAVVVDLVQRQAAR